MRAIAVCLGVGLACAHVCAGVVGWAVLVRGLFVSVRVVVLWWRAADPRHGAIHEVWQQCTRWGGNALDSAALHYLLPSAMLR